MYLDEFLPVERNWSKLEKIYKIFVHWWRKEWRLLESSRKSQKLAKVVRQVQPLLRLQETGTNSVPLYQIRQSMPKSKRLLTNQGKNHSSTAPYPTASTSIHVESDSTSEQTKLFLKPTRARFIDDWTNSPRWISA